MENFNNKDGVNFKCSLNNNVKSLDNSQIPVGYNY